MAIRNFWISAEIDGRSTKLTGGPRNKNGGFWLTVKMRDNGGIIEPIEIHGYERDGELILNMRVNGESQQIMRTRR